MGLLPLFLDNTIEAHRAKTKYVVVAVNDASAVTAYMNEYDYYFYAKKLPISNSTNYDIEVGPILTTKDPSKGTIRFPLYPFDTSLNAGDYIYEIVAIYGNKKVTLAQDKFKLIDSLENSYKTYIVLVDPKKYDFSVHDTSAFLEMFISEDSTWTSSIPNWLTLEPSTGSGPSGSQYLNVNIPSDPVVDQSDSLQITIPSYGVKDIPVTFTIKPLELDPSYHEFFNFNQLLVLDISTNSEHYWKVSSTPSWISNDISSGIGSGTINLTADVSIIHSLGQVLIDSSYYYTQILDVSSYILSPLAFWTFDDTLNDQSGNEFDLINISRGFNIEWIDGKINKACKFDGTLTGNYDCYGHWGGGGYQCEFTLAKNEDANIYELFQDYNKFSFLTWFKADSSGDNTQCFFSSSGLNDNGTDIRLEASGNLIIRRYVWNSSQEIIYDSSISYIDGNWHFIAYTFDSALSNVWFDNIHVANNISTNISLESSGVFFGCEYDRVCGTQTRGRWPYAGALDQTRLFNKVINLNEINAFWNNGAGI